MTELHDAARDLVALWPKLAEALDQRVNDTVPGLRTAFEALVEAEAAHPESDTRGLDVERLRRAHSNVLTRAARDGAVASQRIWGHPGGHTAEHGWTWDEVAAEYTRLSASPDLSIDREGLIAALTTIRDKYGKVCADFEVCVHESCRSSYSAWAVADAAIRGTTQPEPIDV